MTGPIAPDRWLVVELPIPDDEERAGLFIEILLSASGRGVEERQGHLVGYLPEPTEPPEIVVERLRAELSAAAGVEAAVPTWRWQPHEAWAENWKKGFAPRRVSPRILVSPTWESPRLGPDDLLISLDPGMAFGTAEHPTTRSSLRLLERHLTPGERVADIGTGSGILGIAAALLGAGSVLAVESEPWSCAAARENADRNGIGERFHLIEGTVGEDFLPGELPFDGIVANIESGILLPLLPGFARGIRPGGWLILSGILTEEEDRVTEAARRAGFALEVVEREGDWWSGAFRFPAGG